MLRNVVVLRHTLAGDRSTWVGDDSARPLDASGLAQAMALVEALAPWPFGDILTSPSVRCQHTVVAIAADRRIEVHNASWLAVGATPQDIIDGFGRTDGDLLVCTHGECVEAVLTGIAGPAASLPESVGLDKGAAWALSLDGEQLVDLVSIAAPPSAPASPAPRDTAPREKAPRKTAPTETAPREAVKIETDTMRVAGLLS